MCGSRIDVVLCSFAFERVHRRVPLCREHRQPLLEIDHFTRPVAAEGEDVPPAWVTHGSTTPARSAPGRLSRRRPRRSAEWEPTGQLLMMPVR